MAYRYIPVSLAAGETRALGAFGRYCRVLANSLSGTEPYVRLGSQPEQIIPAGVGVDLLDGKDLEKTTFDEVIVRNPSAIDAMALVLAISNAKVDDNRLHLIGSTVFDDILDQLKGAGVAHDWDVVAISDAVATEICPAYTERKSVMVVAYPGNNGVIYLGWDNTVANNKYFVTLNPGDSFYCDDCRASLFGLASINGDLVSFSEV